jgi:hypothetical protein
MTEKHYVFKCPVGDKVCPHHHACNFPDLGCTDDYYSRPPVMVEVEGAQSDPQVTSETSEEESSS